MTPKEKAQELLDYYQHLIFDMVDMSECSGYHGTTIDAASKVVDEILKGDHLLRLPLKYWQDVKEEIEKL